MLEIVLIPVTWLIDLLVTGSVKEIRFRKIVVLTQGIASTLSCNNNYGTYKKVSRLLK